MTIEINKILNMLATIITDTRTHNPTFFDSKLKIKINVYLSSILSYLKYTVAHLICAIIYMDKIMRHVPITNKNIHMLSLTGILIASKYLEDRPYANTTIAALGYTSIKKLNKCEIEFLLLMDYDLVITEDQYMDYYAHFDAICDQ